MLSVPPSRASPYSLCRTFSSSQHSHGYAIIPVSSIGGISLISETGRLGSYNTVDLHFDEQKSGQCGDVSRSVVWGVNQSTPLDVTPDRGFIIPHKQTSFSSLPHKYHVPTHSKSKHLPTSPTLNQTLSQSQDQANQRQGQHASRRHLPYSPRSLRLPYYHQS